MDLKWLVATAVIFASVAFAQPTEFFVWENLNTGETVCDVAAPTSGQWIQKSGPYQDPGCQYPFPQ